MEVKLSKERDQSGEVVSATVTISRDGAFEKRRFATEEEAKEFIDSLRKSDKKNK